MTHDIYKEYYELVSKLELLEKKHVSVVTAITERFVKEVHEISFKISYLHEEMIQQEVKCETGN